jgi:hypothetical protein
MANWTETLHGVLDLDTGIGMEPFPNGANWDVRAYSLAGQGLGSATILPTVKAAFPSIEDATTWVRTFTGSSVVIP